MQLNVFNLIILDESGSMGRIKAPTIEGFNEIVQTIKGAEKEHPNQKHYVSLVTFNGMGIKSLLELADVSKLDELDGRRYQPNASTPMYDAVGQAVTSLRGEVQKHKQSTVLVTIITDGMENASKEFTGQQVKQLVDELQDEGWTFTYIGANHDVIRAAASISIENTLTFHASIEGTRKAYAEDRIARKAYFADLNAAPGNFKKSKRKGYFKK